ncbi:hypothetical protein CUT44_22925 [Streptomyces carminius]|uniref:Trypsin-co-occurring domain-containing protein n=1 Tax=Streptomyces carminius TaxID=2665496 RepID=A0A2M8LU39_9ACTN|nr:CU044_2847 family protein [Streptomyces carminius]PJE95464.1 hypothetical protein CUT44_22925 [Streptomyces carminius]
MPEISDLQLADGTSVRMRLTPVTTAGPGTAIPGHVEPSGQDLPDGLGRSVPVARRARREGAVTELAVGTLRAALRPLGPVLQEVHEAITASERPPHEVTVEFGVEISQDLKLGIVEGGGQAHLQVSATWHISEPSTEP